MPLQDRVGGHDAGQLLEHLPPEDFAFHRQAPALVIVEEDSIFAGFLSEHPILPKQVLDGVLLPPVDPAYKNQKQQLPWLQQDPHVPPNAR